MIELEKLVFELFCWGLKNGWERPKDREYYIKEFVPKLKNSFMVITNDDDQTIRYCKFKISQIKKITSPDEWDNLEKTIQEIAYKRMDYEKQYNATIEGKLNKSWNEFESFKTSNNLSGALNENRIRKQIHGMFNEGKFKDADSFYSKYNSVIPNDEYQLLKLKANLKMMLEKHEFLEADEYYANSGCLISKEEYEELKGRYVKNYLVSVLGERFRDFNDRLDDEKISAISKLSKNLLVKARAGSGKTTTIALKTFFLMQKENVGANEIMVLAFNKKAAQEMQSRIEKWCGIKHFSKAKTFHGLAYAIVQPQEELLFNDGHGEFSRKKLSEFVQDIVKDILGEDKTFEKTMYQHFRKEMSEIESHGLNLNAEEYLIYRRNCSQVSLMGERVKSRGEKYIADFLCEHGIQYFYEKVYFAKGKNYRPDFSLLADNISIIIEHWGIDENDETSKTPHYWTKTRDEYLEEMRWKRSFWAEQKNASLVETSERDLKHGRENFESILKSRLEEKGIRCIKLSEEEILKVTVYDKIARITEMFAQFIQKAKKSEFTPEIIKNKMRDMSLDDRTKLFIVLGIRVFDVYSKKLILKKKLDFDDLIARASYIIETKKGDCDISSISLLNLKWIMVDEYQDFSKLFYRLIDTIRKYNRNIKLLCVGDDWQAINGFAGSDLTYFETFQNSFEDAGITYLQTNFRSHKKIVDAGNRLMGNNGKPAKYLPQNKNGEVKVIPVDRIVHIECRNGDEYFTQKESDSKFIFFDFKDNGFLQARYLKKCYKIILSNMGKNIAILSRTNRIYYCELQLFYNKLKKCFTSDELKQIGSFESKVRYGTAHSFKGLEADIVIILHVCERTFPLLHPDNQLFEIFGQTIKKVMDEERRLFYVALTRAKEKIYILTESSRESLYLDDLGLIEKVQDYKVI